MIPSGQFSLLVTCIQNGSFLIDTSEMNTQTKNYILYSEKDSDTLFELLVIATSSGSKCSFLSNSVHLSLMYTIMIT